MSTTLSSAELAQLESALAIVDALADGVALCDSAGRVTYRNPALAGILVADAEASRLAIEITSAAAGAAALAEHRHDKTAQDAHLVAPAVREVRTAVGRYRLHVSYLGRELLGTDVAVVVLVAQLGVRELTAGELRARYGLSPRGIQVALLLARGRSNAEIAPALGLSRATARHYTEHVLTKLGVHSRAAVAAVLQRTATEE